jgi:hypothetical protein
VQEQQIEHHVADVGEQRFGQHPARLPARVQDVAVGDLSRLQELKRPQNAEISRRVFAQRTVEAEPFW